MPGPPPRPGARQPSSSRAGRIGNTETATKLPAGGRKGKPPPWPLPGRMQAGEAAAWRDAWRTPQAVEWERLGWHRLIARYIRILVEAEQPGANAATRAEAKAMEDRLGLSPMSMLRLRWVLIDDELVPTAAPSSSMASARARLQVVADDGPKGA